MLEVMNSHIPQKKLSGRWNIPWLTASIRKMIRKKQRLYNKAKMSQCIGDWTKFRRLRKVIKESLSEAHHNYISSLLEPSGDDHKPTMRKRFWTYIKSMRKDKVGIAPLRKNIDEEVISKSQMKANLLSKQFESVFTNEDLIIPVTLPKSSSPIIPQLTFTIQGITKLLKKINTRKASGPDQIPCWILKEMADEIAPFLHVILTQSLETGHVPQDWKGANIWSPITDPYP